MKTIVSIYLLALLVILCFGVMPSCTPTVPSPAKVDGPPASASPTPNVQPQVPAPSSGSAVSDIQAIATGSSCERISFAKHGNPRKGWLKGTAIVYARAVCFPDREEVKLISGPAGDDDALAVYGLKGNELAKTYALMVGLAARESEWKYCCGRDMSSGFSSANSAEGGFLQTSRGAAFGKNGVPRAGGALVRLIDKWTASDKAACLLFTYAEGANCGDGDAKNWGDASDPGYKWQALSKSCPAFAAEYGAMVMRIHGGPAGEFGPIRTHAAEFHSECEDMFGKVQQYVKDHPSACAVL